MIRHYANIEHKSHTSRIIQHNTNIPWYERIRPYFWQSRKHLKIESWYKKYFNKESSQPVKSSYKRYGEYINCAHTINKPESIHISTPISEGSIQEGYTQYSPDGEKNIWYRKSPIINTWKEKRVPNKPKIKGRNNKKVWAKQKDNKWIIPS